MKVIIKKTGKIEEVSEGHARNYLLPKGLAVLATSDKVESLNAQHKKAEAAQAQKMALWQSLAKTLEGKEVKMTAAANDDGTLFGSIPESAILDTVNSQHHVSLQSEWIRLAKPIKHVGTHDVTVEFPNKSRTTFVVTIVKQ